MFFPRGSLGTWSKVASCGDQECSKIEHSVNRVSEGVAVEQSNQNEVRAERARRVLKAFQTECGLTEEDGLDVAISDLLCDLAHLCDQEELTFQLLVSRALRHHDVELRLS